jgi:transcriptional regulator with XRE-family HTH domain
MARPSKKDYLLRIVREAKGLSKEQVAVIIEAPMHNVWRSEVGRIISEKIVVKIAKALGIDAEIMFYNMGRFPPGKREFIIKDPLFFKELIEEVCKEPWKLTKTKEYMEKLKNKMKDTEEKSKSNPEIKKILSQIKPSEEEIKND